MSKKTITPIKLNGTASFLSKSTYLTYIRQRVIIQGFKKKASPKAELVRSELRYFKREPPGHDD